MQAKDGALYVDVRCGDAMANLGVLVSGLQPALAVAADRNIVWSKQLQQAPGASLQVDASLLR